MARFLPGQSGNPGGRPKGRGQASRLAREHTPSAIFALVRLSCDLQASHKLQFDAARELLHQGFGSPAASAEESGLTGGGVGRFAGLRTRIEELLTTLDRQHAHYRRLLLMELAELERQEGTTTTKPQAGEDLEELERLEQLEEPEHWQDP